MLQFKRDGDGTWQFGQKRTIAEPGSTWAVNPSSIKRGYICFGDGNKVIGERLAPIWLPMPDITELPDKGFPWTQQWTVEPEVPRRRRRRGRGGLQVDTRSAASRPSPDWSRRCATRLNAGQHDGKVAPIVRLSKDSYQHGQFGRVW